MDLLPLGLAFLVGAVFGYAACLWRWCAAEEARTRAAKPRSTMSREDVLARGVRFSGVPLPPPGAAQTRIYGGAGTSFVVAHDCIDEGCTIPHGGKNSDC